MLWIGNFEITWWGTQYPWTVYRLPHTYGMAYHIGPVSVYRHRHGPFYDPTGRRFYISKVR